MKVFISTTTFAEHSNEPLSILEKNGIDFVVNPLKRKLTEQEIASFLKEGSYAGLVAGTESITKEALEQAKSLKVISRVGVGMDNIDLAEASKLHIRVFNTPDVLVDSVAELTLGLIINCLRKIYSGDRNIHNKIWKKEMGLLFKGKVLGIIGFGKIGRRVSALAKAFGVNIIFYDIRKIKDSFAKQVSLDNIFSYADIISIHFSGKETLISSSEISKMKEGVVLINTSRGSGIDEEALYDGLKSGKVSSAALDVFHNEPYNGKLSDLENCLLTPHIGSYAKEARIEMEIESVNNLIKGLKGLKSPATGKP
ncbi:hydroxyacid dehydrogenase [bacterium]|nr:MAG: hydroxyacid dehydrogenase [bacterium]